MKISVLVCKNMIDNPFGMVVTTTIFLDVISFETYLITLIYYSKMKSKKVNISF